MQKNMAIIENGIVTNIAAVDDTDIDTIAYFGGVLIPDNVPVSIGWVYDGFVLSVPVVPPLTLSRAQEIQLAVIESAYKTAVSKPIAYMGTEFQADAESQQLMASVITACGGSLPAGFAWFDTNNAPVAMSFTQLQGLAGAILLRGQPLFVTKQTKKAAIRAATTVQQVEAVTW